jgi:hypothetical protein
MPFRRHRLEANGEAVLIYQLNKARGRKVRRRIYFPKYLWTRRRCEALRFVIPKSSRWLKSTKVI